ncbi:MAG: hypothetical protein J6W28_06600 [Clostridia bacterium]|nr:hypothetical protein [Clostridia bacterium]MBO7170827.1 hypothetical protein [Clostridia bacterium]
MNQNKKTKKTRLVQVIGLYLLCLLAAVCTWLAVMYEEQKNADKAVAEKTAETVYLSEEEERFYL